MMSTKAKDLGGIIFSDYAEVNRSREHFLENHTFMYIISGRLTIIDVQKSTTFKDGDMMLFRKNNLAKFIKQPPSDGASFLAINLILDKETLLRSGKEQDLSGHSVTPPGIVMPVSPDDLLRNYFTSLLPYFEQPITEDLVRNKKQEFILLLLRNNPGLGNIFFDFGLPGKMDLEAFMKRNFRYNVTMDKLAFLTGRSLATFKRDFEKIFGSTPSRWIKQERLKEAYYMISEKKVKPSDVYLEVGFESLSHFSFAFKQFFGQNPSSL